MVTLLNEAIRAQGTFSFVMLLLPFVLVDVITMVALGASNPWLLIAPWDFEVGDLVIPLSVEFFLFLCVFPVVVYVVNHRMANVQRELRTKLDELSVLWAPRGLHLQLRQRVSGAAQGNAMWVEISVLPFLPQPYPVAVPVPSLYPVLVNDQGEVVVGQQAPNAVRGAQAEQEPAQPSDHARRKAPATSEADGGRRAPERDRDAPASDYATVSQQLQAVTADYVRVLHENQLLRSYLSQYQQQQAMAYASAAAVSTSAGLSTGAAPRGGRPGDQHGGGPAPPAPPGPAWQPGRSAPGGLQPPTGPQTTASAGSGAEAATTTSD